LLFPRNPHAQKNRRKIKRKCTQSHSKREHEQRQRKKQMGNKEKAKSGRKQLYKVVAISVFATATESNNVLIPDYHTFVSSIRTRLNKWILSRENTAPIFITPFFKSIRGFLLLLVFKHELTSQRR